MQGGQELFQETSTSLNSMFLLHFATPPNTSHRLYIYPINLFFPHITHAFDLQSSALSSYHASPINKLHTTPNSLIINI